MSQVFKPSANSLARLILIGVVVVAGGALGFLNEVNRTSYVTHQYEVRDQPVQFSHKHHYAELGIDCRYCHTSVEKSAFANIPPSQICMNCHKIIWSDSPTLEPVRASFATGAPLAWTRVNDLPDFVYFNHSIHIAKGIGCESCHGNLGTMNLTYQAQPLTMEWCLSCHRNPAAYVRPKDQVFNMFWKAQDQASLGPKLVAEYNIHPRTDCDTCHR